MIEAMLERPNISEQEGNLYDERGQLIREKPSPELVEAMRLVRLNHADNPNFPELSADDEEVQQVLAVLKRKKQKPN